MCRTTARRRRGSRRGCPTTTPTTPSAGPTCRQPCRGMRPRWGLRCQQPRRAAAAAAAAAPPACPPRVLSAALSRGARPPPLPCPPPSPARRAAGPAVAGHPQALGASTGPVLHHEERACKMLFAVTLVAFFPHLGGGARLAGARARPRAQPAALGPAAAPLPRRAADPDPSPSSRLPPLPPDSPRPAPTASWASAAPSARRSPSLCSTASRRRPPSSSPLCRPPHPACRRASPASLGGRRQAVAAPPHQGRPQPQASQARRVAGCPGMGQRAGLPAAHPSRSLASPPPPCLRPQGGFVADGKLLVYVSVPEGLRESRPPATQLPHGALPSASASSGGTSAGASASSGGTSPPCGRSPRGPAAALPAAGL